MFRKKEDEKIDRIYIDSLSGQKTDRLTGRWVERWTG